MDEHEEAAGGAGAAGTERGIAAARDRDGTERDGACECRCGSDELLVTLPAFAAVEMCGLRPLSVTFRYDSEGEGEGECPGCGLLLDASGRLHTEGLRLVDPERDLARARPLGAAQAVGRLWRDRQYRLTYASSSAACAGPDIGTCPCSASHVRLTFPADSFLRLMRGAVTAQVFAVRRDGSEPRGECVGCGAAVDVGASDVIAAGGFLRRVPQMQIGR